MSLATNVRETIDRWAPRTAIERDVHREYRSFVGHVGNLLRETSAAQHITASAFVFTPGLDRLVLTYHGKGRFWAQLGGHLEAGDDSLAACAFREATEESGLGTLRLLGGGPVDLDRHGLDSGFGSCQVHWDVGFAFIAHQADGPLASENGDRVAWWPVTALPDGSVAGLGERVAAVLARVGGHGTRSRARTDSEQPHARR